MKSSTLAGLLIAVIVIVGIAWIMNKKSSYPTTPTTTTSYQTSQSNSEYGSPTTTQTPQPTATLQASTTLQVTGTVSNAKSVLISNFTFSPSTLTVKKGTKVTWTNQDSVSHTVTGVHDGPSSGTLSHGQSYSYTFSTVGTFNYFCKIHPSMKGTVVVTD